MPPIANPQLPDYVHPSEHSSRQKYLQHTVDTLVYFYVRSHVYVEMLAVLARDEKQQQDAYNSAQVRWKGDPMVASGVFPQTPGGRQQYLMKCYQMSTANVKTASEATLCSIYSHAAAQLLVAELNVFAPNDMKAFTYVVVSSRDKAMKALGIFEAFHKSSQKGIAGEILSKIFDRIGDTITYQYDRAGHTATATILNGGVDVMGEAWFFVEENINNRKTERYVSDEEMEALLKTEIRK
ncbi:unnamed protein product [Somion occarium]|uniref:Uncharacterized protein n=1 Tax=Somion occarium TaxID=3059160 RepID=A0ABP1DBY9_9APHY